MQTKTTRKIIKFLLAGVVALGAIFVPLKDIPHAEPVHTSSVVYAATAGTGSSVSTASSSIDSKKEFAEILEIILKLIYLLMWPLIALAGLALDNGMVYGTYFQLDAALFTFRNIVKNFANFALGFLFLRSILKYIFNFGSKAQNPMGMITKLLIAGIGIQASWFVMGGLIDLSTVATVGVGGLPLQLLDQQAAGNQPVFGVKTNMKVSDMGNSLTAEKGFVILYTYPTKSDEYYLPCAVVNQKVLEGEDWAKTFGITATGRKLGNSDATWEQINKSYCMFGNNVLSFDEARGKKIQGGSQELKTILVKSQDKFLSENKCSDPGNLCQTIANIAQKGQGYQGAFYSLYGSILNMGSIHVATNKSEGSMTMEAMIKAVIGVAYLIPLLVLCVILIVRIAVLWIVIAFSPVLVLSEVFGRKMKSYDKFQTKNVISLIFLPVVATFAISISIVFLSVLSEGMTKGNSLEKIGMNTYAEGNKSCINLVVTTLCIDTPSQDVGVSGMLDFFPWLILNIFGIGLMRTILMASMKTTSFTSGIVDSVDKFARNMISTAPIIPIGGGVSARSVQEAGKQISGSIEGAANKNATEVVSPMLENLLQKNSGRVGRGKEELTAASAKLGTGAKAADAKAAVTTLVSPKGVLYNEPGAAGIINNKSNNLDLSQYGNSGLDFVNRVAATNNMKPYGSVDEAFKDEKFLRYLADNNRGLGLTEEQIKSFYSGRDGKGNATHEEINEKIERIVAEAASTVSVKGTRTGKTYKTVDETVYTITKQGFTEKKKDGTETKHQDEKSWESLLPYMDKDTMRKMKDDSKETLEPKFEEWLTGKKPTTTTTPTNTNNTNPAPTATTSQPQPATPVNPATSSNTSNTTTTPNNNNAQPNTNTTTNTNSNPPTNTPPTNTSTPTP